jgi:hypothetical protein
MRGQGANLLDGGVDHLDSEVVIRVDCVIRPAPHESDPQANRTALLAQYQRAQQPRSHGLQHTHTACRLTAQVCGYSHRALRNVLKLQFRDAHQGPSGGRGVESPATDANDLRASTPRA